MDNGVVTDRVTALLLLIFSQWTESLLTKVHTGKCLQMLAKT